MRALHLTSKTITRLTGAPGRRIRQARWSRIEGLDQPISVKVSEKAALRLYPHGQIAQYLYVGCFEQTELRQVARFLKCGMNVIDIGANIGLYSALSSLLIGSEGRVWAFEPSSETACRLSRNLELNQCSNVEIIRKALSDIDGGSLTLRRDPGFGDGERYVCSNSSGSCERRTDADKGDEENVPVTTLDVWWSDLGESRPRVDFIKMDVEGSELSVLRGAAKLLADSPDVVIMLECQEKHCAKFGHRPSDVWGVLKGHGLRVFAVDTRTGMWSETDDVLLRADNLWACRLPEVLPEP